MTHRRFFPPSPAVRPHSGAWLVFALSLGLGSWLSLGSAAAQTFRDDLVPGGAWRLGTEVRYDHQAEAYTRKNKTRFMRDYVIPADGTRKQIEGDLTRTIFRAEFELQYGWSDTWNLALAVPLLHMEQKSSLRAVAEADAEARATVARLGDRELTGLGDARLTSLHRVLYSDRHAWVLGYGVRGPLGEPESAYDGVGTFDLRSPGAAAFLLAHYAYFPAGIQRARLDLRLLTGKGFDTSVEKAEGGTATLVQGNFSDVRAAWTSEIGRVLLGFDLEHLVTTPNILDGKVQHDNSLETRARLRLGYGNLIDLEAAPIPFPYQLWVGGETSLRGFNRPVSRGVTFVFQTFF